MAVSIADIFTELGVGKELEDFYYNSICTNNYQYVIIVPRKCMTEYKCLCKEHSDWEFHRDVYYMTPKSYIQYKAQIIDEIKRGEDFSILIIDDIMMHGRGIDQVLQNMVTGMSEDIERKMIDRINISVFIESNKDFIIDEKFRPILEERSSCYFSYHEFKNVLRASDLFLESFYAKLVPNTSFVNAWYYKDWQKGHDVREKLGTGNESSKKAVPFCYTIQNKAEQDKYGFRSVVYSEKQENWMENLAEFCCVRYYCNEEGYNPFLIPYAFLRPMTGVQIDSLLERFEKALGIPHVWEGKSDDFYVLKYEYLTKLVSDCYGIIFMKRYLESCNENVFSWDSEYIEDDIVSEFTFGRGNILPMEELCKKLGNDPAGKMESICKDFSTDSIEEFKEESNSGRLFEKAVDEADADVSSGPEHLFYQLILDNFLKRSNLQDEKLAEERKERYYGLSTIRIRNILEIRKKLSERGRAELYGEMVRCMDTGTAAISIKRITNKGKVYYGAIVNSGEQAYRELQEKNAVEIHYMALIEQDCRNLCMSRETENKIDDFWKDVEKIRKDTKISFHGIEEVRNAVRERNGKYSEIDIKRFADTEAESRDKICCEAYRKIEY